MKFRTLVLAEEFYTLTEELGLTGNLKDQLIRASSSIALNLAEGNAKQSVKEKKRYYKITYGSAKECQSIIHLAKVNDQKLIGQADRLGACLWKLVRSELRVFGDKNE